MVTNHVELERRVRDRLREFALRSGKDKRVIVKDSGISARTVHTWLEEEDKPCNPTVRNIADYVESCGFSLGEFFEAWLPLESPVQSHRVNRIIAAAMKREDLRPNVLGLVSILEKLLAQH